MWRVALGALAIVCLGWSVYGETLSFPFVYDDESNITQNAGIRVGGPLGWESLRLWSPTPRPVANASLALNFAWGGYAVEGYRSLNVWIHVLTSCLVGLLCWQVLRRYGELPGQRGSEMSPDVRFLLSLFSGLLFVSHPLATQSVVYVVQRMTSLSVLFYVGGLCAWIGGGGVSGGGRVGLRFLACVLGLLSLGSKEIGATFPLALWLWEWGFARDGSRSFFFRSVPWFGVLLGSLLLLSWWYASGDPLSGYASKPFTLWERLWTEPRVWWRYVGLSLFPVPVRLSVIHDLEMSTGPWSPWTTWFSCLSWLAVLWWGWRCRFRWRLCTALVFWWLLQQQVEGSFLPLEPMYEHRTYLPLVGLSVFVPWGCWRLLSGVLGPRWGSISGLALGVCAVLGLSFAAHARAQVWSDPVTLWQDALAKAPGHRSSRVNYAVSLLAAGRWGEARGAFEDAVARHPDSFVAHRSLGALAVAERRFDDAAPHFRAALEREPLDPMSWAGLGTVAMEQGRVEEAISLHERSLSIGWDPRVQTNLGQIFRRAGRLEEALAQFRQSLYISPAQPIALRELAGTALDRGLLEEASSALDRAEALEPGNPRHELLAARLAEARRAASVERAE